jgi:methionyl-tRNA formyltransferase
MGKLDFTKSAVALDRQIRSMTPWPSAFTKWNGKQMKIWKALPVECTEKAQPGSVVSVTKDDFIVKTGEGALKICELQLEGKKRMSVHDFLLGVKVQAGDLLG